MDNVNKTLYIPLYGKAFVSRRGIILDDRKAERVWDREGFELKGKSRSKWLAFYMGMRAAVFDEWLGYEMGRDSGAVIVHIGCGMDSRIDRVGANGHIWYDIDFPEVITERRKYYSETEFYHMTAADVRDESKTDVLPSGESAVVVLEGVSMYFTNDEFRRLLTLLNSRFGSVRILTDCYTICAARASKYKNPINDVGVTKVYGIDDPRTLEDGTGLVFIREHDITPKRYVDELKGAEKTIFRLIFGGRISRAMYRLYEYSSKDI